MRNFLKLLITGSTICFAVAASANLASAHDYSGGYGNNGHGSNYGTETTTAVTNQTTPTTVKCNQDTTTTTQPTPETTPVTETTVPVTLSTQPTPTTDTQPVPTTVPLPPTTTRVTTPPTVYVPPVTIHETTTTAKQVVVPPSQPKTPITLIRIGTGVSQTLPFTGSSTTFPTIFGLSCVTAGGLLLLRKRNQSPARSRI